MLRILIAEDDLAMRLVLKKVIEDIPNIELIGEAENGKQLVQLVEELKPDAVFIDIDMPEKNGIEASREIFDIDPHIFIVFVTAFDNYTHQAFEVYAFDYLVKPFKLDRIRKTIQRIQTLMLERDSNLLLHRIPGAANSQDLKLMFQTNEKCRFVNMSDIIMITRSERKTTIYTTQGVLTTYESLQLLEGRLKGELFFRSHKGYIINKDMVIELSPWGNKSYLVRMANIKETALMTFEKAKEFRKMYCI